MVVAVGLILMLSSGGSPVPTPLSIATLVALVVVHERVEAPPSPIVAGATVKLSIVGGGWTVIYAVCVSVPELPPGPVTVRLTG